MTFLAANGTTLSVSAITTNTGNLTAGNTTYAGTLSLGNITATGNATISGNVAIGTASTWVVGSGYVLNANGSLSGSNNLTVGNSTYTGTLLVSGNSSSFTGNTTVSYGTLQLDGSLGSGTVAVNSGAALTGCGTANGAVTVNGTISPHDAGATTAGNLTIGGNLTLQSAAKLNVNLGNTTIGSDLVKVTGNLTLPGTGTITIAANTTALGTFGGAGNYTLIQSGNLTGYSGTGWNVTGLGGNVLQSGNNLVLQVTGIGTTTTVTSSSSYTVLGRSVVFTATVSASSGTPTGTVTFLDNGTSMGTGVLNGNATDTATLSLATTLSPAGTYAITASYAGGGGFAPSTLANFTYTVDPAILTWSGTTSANMSIATNWNGQNNEHVAPINNDSLVFPSGAGNLTITDDMSGLTVNSITISGANYTIGGSNTLSLGGGLSNTGANNTVSVPLALTTAETVSAASSTSLTLSGNVAEGANLLTVAGNGTTTISGVLSGSGGLAKSGTGNLTLSAANSGLSGNVTVNAGVVNVGNTQALGNGTVTENGGKVSLQAAAGASSGSIGFEFYGWPAPTPRVPATLATTDFTGVVVSQGNWNVQPAPATQQSGGNVTALKDNTGTATTAGITWNTPDSWHLDLGAAGGVPFEELQYGFIKPGAAPTTITLALSGVPYSKYDVYVYFNSDSAGTWSIGDGRPTTYYGAINNALTTFTQDTSTSNAAYTPSNYVVFTGETTSSLNVIYTDVTGNGGITGIQIVNTAGSGAASYANNFVVSGNSGLDVTGASAATIGSLTIGSRTLSVTGGSYRRQHGLLPDDRHCHADRQPHDRRGQQRQRHGHAHPRRAQRRRHHGQNRYHPGQRHGDARQRCHQPNQRHRRQRQRHIDPEFQQRHCSLEPD